MRREDAALRTGSDYANRARGQPSGRVLAPVGPIPAPAGRPPVTTCPAAVAIPIKTSVVCYGELAAAGAPVGATNRDHDSGYNGAALASRHRPPQLGSQLPANGPPFS